ncbi:preprotein translocase subunit SecE [Gorillibacterium sp. sgz500922]|uniref:preprotein translocase subunit SecE n=1 Tax=Gorillibacterium sp. sgz500922 TaxID=3446694 RepID=UPI003F661590
MGFVARMKQGFSSTFSFFAESWAELRKVKWPGRKELTSYTIVVITTVIFVGIYFTVLDLIISEIVRLVTK